MAASGGGHANHLRQTVRGSHVKPHQIHFIVHNSRLNSFAKHINAIHFQWHYILEFINSQTPPSAILSLDTQINFPSSIKQAIIARCISNYDAFNLCVITPSIFSFKLHSKIVYDFLNGAFFLLLKSNNNKTTNEWVDEKKIIYKWLWTALWNSAWFLVQHGSFRFV